MSLFFDLISDNKLPMKINKRGFLVVTGLFIFFSFLLSFKEKTFQTKKITQVDCLFGLAKSIVEEPRLMTKWFKYIDMFRFNEITKVDDDNYLLNIKIFSLYEENFKI